MLKNITDRRILLIAFILMVFIAIPSSFAGDSSAIDYAAGSSDVALDDVATVDASDSIDEIISVESNVDDGKLLNDESGGVDDVLSNQDAAALGDGASWTIEGSSTTYSSLGDAVDASTDGATIVGAPGTEETVSSTLKISKNVNIIAANSGDVVLKGSTNSVLNISEGYTVNLVNIAFKDYSIPGSMNIRGGAIYNNGTMSITSCTFENITISGTSGYAPAIYNYGNMVINDCVFDSLTGYYGAPIYSYYSGPYGNYKRSNITVANSTFRKISSNQVGVLYLYQNGKNEVVNCTFEDLDLKHAVIHINTVNATIENCTFKNINVTSTSSSDYAAVLQSQQTGNNITFAGNYIDGVNFSGSTTSNGGTCLVLSRGTVGGAGRADIYNNIIVNSKVTNNAADSTYSYVGSSLINSANGNVNYNIFANNEVSGLTGKTYDVLAFGSVDANYNYWGSNEGPNSTSHSSNITVDYWTTLNVEIPDSIFIGSSEEIIFKLQAMNSAGTASDLPDASGTIALPISSVLNDVPSEVIINKGTGSFTYEADESGDETLTLATGDSYPFEVSADASSLIYVDDVAGTADGPGDANHPYKTIAQALNVATNGKTIIIRSGTYKEHTLSVNVDVEIRADKDAEVIIDAENLGRVFIIDADVSLRDLTLINGESTACGGAIFLSGGSLTANRINIYNSTAGTGGAIATWSTASSLNITNSKFVDNSINPNAYGAYTNGGGAIYSNIPNTFITDSVFVNNKANIEGGSQGGAIYLADDGIIANNEFTENSATYGSQGYGGAIYAESEDNNVTIVNNVFSANNADKGGAIYIDSSAETNIIGNTFTNNEAGLCGGAVYVGDTEGIISDNTFNGNSASDANNGQGGSIYIESSNITLSGNTISASAAKVGSKIFVNGDSNLVGTTTTFLSNVTVGLEKGDSIDITAIVTDDKGNVIVGGSIEFIVGVENLGSVPVSTDDPVVKTYTIAEDAENDLLVTGSYSLDEGSTIKTAVLHPCVLHWFIEGKNGGYEFLSDAVAAAESGDVIYGLSDTYDISTIEINKDVTIKANNTGDIILNIVSGKFAKISNGAVVNLKNLIIQNGKSTLGAAVQVSSSTLNVENCIFKDANYSVSTYDTYGGYIYALRSNVNIIDSAFTKINASGTYAYGGAIYASGCNLNIINSNFTDLVSSNGGAIYSYTTNLTVDNSTFDNVSSTGTSGAISINMNSNVTINNSLFENNYASTSGGALYASGGKLNVNNTVFVNNRANSASSYGAAIYTSIDGNITYCVFINNTEGRPTPVGSDIYLSSSSRVLNIDYCYFGTNEKPTNASVSNYALTNLHNWAILDLSIDHVPVQGSTATVTIELSKYTDGEETSSLESFLPGLTFDISALIGSVEPAYVTLDDENSAKATIEYNALSIGPEVIAASLLGNEVANLTFDVTPDSATTIFVSAEGSDVDGTGSELSPYATIERALSDVNEVKNVIYVKEGTYTEHNINVNKNVSIIGENDNVIIDAEGNSNIFNISEELEVTLDRLTLTNATVASGDGVIRTKSAVVLNNIVIDDVEGTVIYSDGAKFDTIITFIEGSVMKALKGSEVTINASVTDINGFSIAGGVVDFTLNDILNGSTIVGDNGIATFTLTLSDDYVDYVVSGNYSLSNEETVVTGLLRAIQYNWFLNDNVVGYETLAEAVEAAENGDVITGLPGTYTANGIKIDKQITIKANESDSIVLDGDGKQIFNISSKVDLINLTLENGITTAPGGLINLTSSQADLSIIDCTLRDSLSTANGGAINVVYGKLNIINSKFSNISARIGGIIYHNTNFAEINIVNSSFDNIKTTSDGTVLYSCGNVTVVGSNFTNIQGSTSSSDYGVIYIKTPGNLTVTESVFANINGPGGAAIYHVGSGAINVTRNIFTNITALTKGSIYSSGTTSQSYVNYNVFLNNNMDINASSTSVKLNADYNYFGSNDQPTAKNINYDSLYTYWAVLDASLNDTSAIVGNHYTISVALANYTDGTENYTLETPLPEFDIDLSALFGTVEPATLTVSNEVATATYTPVAAGDEIITVGPETIELRVVFDGDYALLSNVTELNLGMNESVIINISVVNANGALSEDLNGETVTVTYNIGDESYTATATVEGSTILFNTSDLTALKPGVSSQVKFSIVKDGKTIVPLDITINVEKSSTTLDSVDSVSIKVGSGSVEVTIKDELGNELVGKTIVLSIGDDISLSAVSDANGVATIDLSSLAYGNYDATIRFAGDESYIGSSKVIAIAVDKYESSIGLARDGDDIVATLTSAGAPVEGKTLTAIINGETVTAVSDANGIAKFDISALSPNNYTIVVSFTDDAYADASESIDIEIPKYATAINAEDITVTTGSGTLDVTLTSDGVPVEGKTIIATFNDSNLTAVTDANGIASIDLSSLSVDTYNVEIKFNGDDSYEGSAKNVVVTVKEVPKTSEDLQKLIDETPAGGVLNLSNMEFTDISGINITKDITIVADNVTIASAGNGEPVFNIASNVSNVSISGVEFIANNGDVLVKATATNGTDDLSIVNPAIELTNNTVTPASDDVVPSSVTLFELESERAVLAPSNPINIVDNNLPEGAKAFDFEIAGLNNGSGINIPQGGNINTNGSSGGTTPKVATTIVAKAMKTTTVNTKINGKKAGKNYSITLKDSKGNVLAGKQVLISFNGKIYKRTTNAKGVATIKIALAKKGTYPVVVSFLGDEKYNGSFVVAKIKVNPQKVKLTVAKKTYKRSKKTKYLYATLKATNKKAIKGKKLVFIINKKKYTAKTNKKGVAKVKVKLSKRKTYKFTVKFLGDNTFKKISKKGKVKIK